MISVFVIWFTSRPSTKQVSFGWHGAKLIGTTISILTIRVLTSGLVYDAVQRMMKYDFEVDASTMVMISSIGIC